MKAPRRSLIFFLLVFFFVSACRWTISPATQATPTWTPTQPAEEPITPTTEAATIPIPSDTPVPGPTALANGSTADFQAFAAQVAAAIQDQNAAFFGGQALVTDWNCLGGETAGVCKGHAAGSVLHGIPVTQDWAGYRLYDKSGYQGLWRKLFANHDVLQLAGLANQTGDNPLMPMADQSFMAVISVAAKSAPTSVRALRVLYFEYNGQSWQLDGELDVITNVSDWLGGACSSCYDTWTAWPK